MLLLYNWYWIWLLVGKVGNLLLILNLFRFLFILVLNFVLLLIFKVFWCIMFLVFGVIVVKLVLSLIWVVFLLLVKCNILVVNKVVNWEFKFCIVILIIFFFFFKLLGMSIWVRENRV